MSASPSTAPDPPSTSTQQIEDLPSTVANEKAHEDRANGAGIERNTEQNRGGQEDEAKQQKRNLQDKKKDGPSGGYDDTRVPRPPSGFVGYTIKITLHKATDLAIGDAHAMSSDPYVLAQLNTKMPSRHKEDPPLRWRTPTVRKHTDPEWNEEWIVANIPSSGFTLKLRVYDEDPDSDDRLGKCHIDVGPLTDQWPGISHETYRLALRDSSRRAVLIRGIATCFRMVDRFRGDFTLSMELLGRTEDHGQGTLAYTIGPLRWCQHYSPVLGHLTNTKTPGDSTDIQKTTSGEHEKSIQQYDFQANELQLAGPIPSQLYHRYVEFKPWVGRLFTSKGLTGMALSKALRHQHSRVYNFSRSTVWGHFSQDPQQEVTRKFLELCHYDVGGRIFTYILTLDALWRFTETGKEFGIDMLSKHTMHSNVSVYIAFSGEFFIRRTKHRRRQPSPHRTERKSRSHSPSHSAREDKLHPNDPRQKLTEEEMPSDPSHYELVIDNDSGTYRPNADLLPVLASYLATCLPGLHIHTLDCQADAEKMERMKSEQRERKKQEGDTIVYTQGDDSSSVSSSDDERLHEIEADYLEEDSGPNGSTSKQHSKQTRRLKQAGKDVKLQNHQKAEKLERTYGPKTKEAVEKATAGSSHQGGESA